MRVAWLGPHDGAVACGFEIEVVAEPPADADVIVVDTRAVPAGGLGAALVGVRAVAVVRCADDEIAAVLAAVRAGDDVSVRGEPPALVAHRIRAAALRAFPDRDGLTGLPTRPRFQAELVAALAAACPSRPAALILFDLDHLKRINDSHGHDAGDRVLAAFGQRLRALAPAGAVVARIGGEELAIVAALGADDATALAEAVLSDLRTQPLAGHACTASAGVAVRDRPDDPAALLRDVDGAVYAAKARGRDQVVRHAELARAAADAHRDLAVEAFEASARMLAEKVADTIARRGRRLFEQLREEADVDVLTRLYNRRYLDRRLPVELDQAVRAGRPLTIALLDLDAFGLVNKQFGWPAGDRVLTDVAARIRKNVRATDWVARYGGEEICIVMADTDAAQAAAVLERIRAAIASQPFALDAGRWLDMTVSGGAASRPDARADDDTLQALLERASSRLLEAKRCGKNRIVLA